MYIHDVILKSVGFVGKVAHRDDNSFVGENCATGFFVTIDAAIPGGRYLYFVTAKHVITELKNGEAYCQVNKKGGGVTLNIPVVNDHFWFHPTDKTADVAVAEIMPSPSEPDIVLITQQMFVTRDMFGPQHRIGIGSDVFITGLFTHAQEFTTGKEGPMNVPIVRHGNIAMLPKNQIYTSGGFADVYLVEARSIGGLSGSPVFVRETIDTMADLNGEQVRVSGLGRTYLLGLMHGHWDVDESQINSPRPRSGPRGVNMGIGVVVPAYKILEVLNRPELQKNRDEANARALKAGPGNAPTMDISTRSASSS